jgi:hypothetical protein
MPNGFGRTTLQLTSRKRAIEKALLRATPLLTLEIERLSLAGLALNSQVDAGRTRDLAAHLWRGANEGPRGRQPR